MPSPLRWDIFCTVVDNYGDAGLAWRLARQLADEHGHSAHLYVDALASLARIAPGIDVTRDEQMAHGVSVHRWNGPHGDLPFSPPADVVIEAFGCGLPPSYLNAMARRDPKPIWINLEYLSAEDWIESCHGLASRHPQLPLTRYFFFPGFTATSGGLLRERDLLARRDAFQSDAGAKTTLWRKLALPEPAAGTRLLSLFCYPNAGSPVLFDAWAQGVEPILCVLPEGVASAKPATWAGRSPPPPGQTLSRGRLMLATIPFLAQDDYDRLLWACDVNFVRGEDSFVRAQWAARPFVWDIYKQADDAHRLKLDAFLARYRAGLAQHAATAMESFSRAWNDDSDASPLWDAFDASREPLRTHAKAWAAMLATRTDLVSELVDFVAGLI